MKKNKTTILIIGIAGGLAQVTARKIMSADPDTEIVGIDNRSIDFKHPNVITEKLRYTKGQFENLFRRYQFDYVIHLARLTHSKDSDFDLEKRLNFNIMSTHIILDLCKEFQIKKLIFLSTYHVYGALADNSVFLSEDDPLRASLKYSELRDVVEMDQMMSSYVSIHGNPFEVIIFRPTNIVGPLIKNSMTQFLTHPLSFYSVEYNPMFQFISDLDVADIIALSLYKVPSGVYNLAPNDFISFKEALEIVKNNHAKPFSILMAGLMNKMVHLVPDYLLDYLKFSSLIDNKKIVSLLGKNIFSHSSAKSLELLKIY